MTKDIIASYDPEIRFVSVQSPIDALSLLKKEHFDCVVTDYIMPGMDGIEFAEHVRRRSKVPIILYTGQGSEEVAERAFQVGIVDYIRKEVNPAHYQVLDIRIRSVVEKTRTEDLYQTVVENCPVAFTIIKQGIIVYANKVMVSILDLTDASELVGDNFIHWVSIEDRERIEKMYDKGLLAKATRKPKQIRLRRIDGHVRTLDFSSSAIIYGGEPAYLVFGRDVTDLLNYQRRLEALQVHAERLAEAKDMKEVRSATMDTIESVLDHHLITYMELHGNDLYASETRGSPLLDLPLSLNGKGLTVKAAREKRPVMVNDIRVDPDYIKGSTDSLSELAVPVLLDGETVIVLNVESLSLNAFDDDDRRLMETLARHVGAALKRLKAVEVEKTGKKKLEALHRHATRMVDMETMDKIADYTFDIISELLGFTDGTIGVVEGNYLKFVYARNVPHEILPDLSLNGKGITVKAVKTGETQIIRDTRLDPNYVRDIEEVRSLSELDVPVKVDEKVVAVINIEDEKPDAFTTEDKEIIEIISEHMAAALSRIEKAKAVKASEERYRKLLESSLDSVVILSDTRIIYANKVAAKMLGYETPSELIGKDVTIVLTEEEKERVVNLIKSGHNGELQPTRYEIKLAKKEGGTVYVDTSVNVVTLDSQQVVVAFSRDITERKRYESRIMALHRHAAQLEIAESLEEISKSTLEAINDVLGFELASFLVNEEGILSSVENIGCDLLGVKIPVNGRGITAKAIRERKTILNNNLSCDKDYLRVHIDSLSELAVPVTVDNKIVAVLNVESIKKEAFTENDAKILETLATHVASAMKRIVKDRLIAQNEERYRAITDNSDNAIITIDDNMKVSYWNKAASKLFGYSSEEAYGRDITSMIFTVKSANLLKQRLKETEKQKKNLFEERVYSRKGKELNIEYSIATINYSDSTPFVLFIRDVTTQKHNQQKILKLHESSEKLTGADSLNMVWDTAMDTVGKILGFDFSGIAVNEGENFRYVRIIGDEKALDWSFSLQKPSITGKVIKTGLPQYIRDTTLDPEYEKGPGDAPQQSEIALPIKVEDRVVAVLNVEGEYNTLFNDVDINLLEILVGQLSSAATRIMKKEEEVRAKEKHTKDLIEGADRLSSMVRHDLRGPLQTIKAASYLIRKDPERYEDYTQRIDDCVDHANKLLEDLKNVLRPGEFITIPVNLSELAEHCLNDIIIPERISLLKNLETPVIALVDPHRVRRVIDNLVKNAIEAMPEGGKLTVSTEKEGDKAVITITDTGIGIDDVVKKNLFTPFITTKKTGTGLGLAICKRIVEDHGGTIIYDTKKNKGTSFTVTIPIQAEKLPTDKIEEQIPLEIQNTASE